jgi:hypothetical protein
VFRAHGARLFRNGPERPIAWRKVEQEAQVIEVTRLASANFGTPLFAAVAERRTGTVSVIAYPF